MGSRKQLKSTRSAADPPASSTSSTPAHNNHSAPQKPASGGGWTTRTWPRGQKAAAVTEVARESISAAGNIASELVASTTSLPDSPKTFRTNSIQLTRKAGVSSRSLPANATTTRINIASNGSSSAVPDIGPLEDPSSISSGHAVKPAEKDSLDATANAKDTETLDQPDAEATQTTPGLPVQQNNTQSSWFGWFSWGAGTADKASPKEHDMGPPDDEPKPKSAPAECHEASDSTKNNHDAAEVPDVSAATQQVLTDTTVPESQTLGRRSAEFHVEHDQPASQPITVPSTAQTPQIEQPQQSESHKQRSDSKPSGWAFWSREAPKTDVLSTKQPEETGELVMSEQVQSKAKPDDNVPQIDTQPTLSTSPKPAKPATPVKSAGSKNIKANKPATEDTVEPTAVTDTIPAPIPAKVKTQEPTASKQLQNVLTNQLLPAFRDTFPLQESASWLQTLGRLLHYSKDPEIQHVSRSRDPPRPKRCLAIGVHGYFPAPYLRTVLGQPTGTSLKFSTMAAKAIHRWAESHGYHCDVEKISLEGEGRIADRVDLLWKLLLRWMEEIRKAEFIMFACHSQGVPVTIMLVAKLIAFGCLDAARVGICAMAGVNLGPFPDYKSRWIGGSAGELFDFASPTTKVSKDYEMALKTCLDFGVRVTYVGSIDDQLVSLESSLFDPVSHPYIYRAVFVDGKVHAPSFLSHLVGFTLKLRNLGVHDHGLIRELSTPLVGSLVGGEGHSRLHDEENIYHMAVEFALETSNVNGATLHSKRHHLLSAPTNPYILPFALRGLLEEDYVRHELHQESIELLKQFDEWKPTTKVLKDVKFRLEGIRSKL
ncbi:putative protein YML020W [Talaromyces islandicus]|uniref:YMC020W-like alpha/beta hydrolase domain-containing protein n=1 Tax=Talaromyces islandicus TaxID=28573 RepID=A0A0U1LPB4_TALIS|nr:putative protein YML020W [Talaromyces islandicus]